jgi:3-oxoadipate enol-lactonase
VSVVALHYTVDGPTDAPPLVLGPSLGTNMQLWEPQMPALAERFRVIRYDHRGHGASPVPDGPYCLADLGGDVLALMDRLGVNRAHVAGLSLGGMVGMWLAAHAPDRVDRLVLVCTSARLGPPQMWAARAATVRTEGMGAIADAVLGRWVPEEFAAREPGAVNRLRAMLLATPPEGYAACCEAIQAMDLLPELAQIQADTLVIAGLEDAATPPAHAQRIISGIPQARLALIGGAAHLANVSRPDLVGRLLTDFLGDGHASGEPHD